MEILLIGQEGQLAFELERTLACIGSVTALGRQSHIPLDLLDLKGVSAIVRALKPDLIVNAAAYTAVDNAESHQDLAYRINAEAVAQLAQDAKGLKIPIVHYSTDYVFDGQSSHAYLEDDPTGPLSVYGHSKLQGEIALRDAGIPHLIFRTAWVYGRRGQNFLLTMLRLMKEREVLSIVDDQRGAPTWCRLIAEATTLALSQCTHEGRLQLGHRQGTYHLTAGGETTWYGFAEAIRKLGIERGYLPEACATLSAITTAQYPTAARRPAHAVLGTQKLRAAFGIALPTWDKGLDLCLTAMGD
jgi:dTDP-4-dehydrorhamnose reductase